MGEKAQNDMVTHLAAIETATEASVAGVTLGDGAKTVTTAASGPEKLVATTTPVKWVIIESYEDNTSRIALGVAGVDATDGSGEGITLAATSDRITLYNVDLTDIYVDALTDGDGVRFLYGA